ncbi:Uncharacterized protein PBTT_00619 [Plasmodiophora brassicae]
MPEAIARIMAVTVMAFGIVGASTVVTTSHGFVDLVVTGAVPALVVREGSGDPLTLALTPGQAVYRVADLVPGRSYRIDAGQDARIEPDGGWVVHVQRPALRATAVLGVSTTVSVYDDERDVPLTLSIATASTCTPPVNSTGAVAAEDFDAVCVAPSDITKPSLRTTRRWAAIVALLIGQQFCALSLVRALRWGRS